MACITKKRGKPVIDFYDQHGKRRLKTLPKGTTKKEARRTLQEILKQVEHGTYLPDKRIPTFSELADQWLEHKKINIREHSFTAYECHIRRNLKPFYGNTKITRIALKIVKPRQKYRFWKRRKGKIRNMTVRTYTEPV